MKYNFSYKKKRKLPKVSSICIIVIILLITISVGYSKLSTELTIRGNVTGIVLGPNLPAKIVPPVEGGSRLTTDVATTNDLSNYLYVTQDVFQSPNTVVTELENGATVKKSKGSYTFTLVLKNETRYTWTNGTYTVDKNNLSNFSTLKSSSISKTTVQSGETVEISMTIDFKDLKKKMPVGQYFTINVAYMCNGESRDYNYKVMVVA